MPTFTNEAESFPGLSDISTAKTQCDTLIGPTAVPSAIEGKSIIVRLLCNIYTTITYYCKICTNCVLRDKRAKEITAEYCKRVFLIMEL